MYIKSIFLSLVKNIYSVKKLQKFNNMSEILSSCIQRPYLFFRIFAVVNVIKHFTCIFIMLSYCNLFLILNEASNERVYRSHLDRPDPCLIPMSYQKLFTMNVVGAGPTVMSRLIHQKTSCVTLNATEKKFDGQP